MLPFSFYLLPWLTKLHAHFFKFYFINTSVKLSIHNDSQSITINTEHKFPAQHNYCTYINYLSQHEVISDHLKKASLQTMTSVHSQLAVTIYLNPKSYQHAINIHRLLTTQKHNRPFIKLQWHNRLQKVAPESFCLFMVNYSQVSYDNEVHQ